MATLEDVYIYANNVLAGLFNGILIYLIVYHTKSDMGAYKYLMLTFSMFGVFLDIVNILVRADFVVLDYSMFVIYNGPCKEFLGRFAQGIFVTILSGFFCESIVLLGFHFVYRYFAICRTNLSYLFYTPRGILMWIGIFMTISGAFMGLCLRITKTISETEVYAAEFIMREYNVNISAVGYIGFDMKIGDEYQWAELPFVLMAFFLVLSFVFPIPILVFLIVRKFDTIEMSPTTRHLHKQLLIALILQTLIPLLTTHLPAAALFLCPVFGYSPSPHFGRYFAVLFVTYPTVDPLISIFIIRNFKLEPNYVKSITTSCGFYMATLADVQEYYIYANNVLTGLFNGVLIYLIVFHTKCDMGAYKYLMITFSMFGFFFNIMNTVVRAEFVIFEHSMFVIYNGLCKKYLGRFAQTIIVTILSGFFWESIVLLGFHFVYRYFAICRTNLAYLFYTPRGILMWIVVFMTISGTFMGLCFRMTIITTDVGIDASEFIMREYNLNISNAGYIGFILKIGDKYQWTQLLYVLLSFLLALSFVASILIFVFLIVRKFHTIEMSPKTRSLHKQLLTALILQTLIPLLTTHFPTGAMFLCPVFGYTPNAHIGRILAMSFVTYPAVDPLISIFFIKDYRRVVLQLFCTKRNRRQSLEVNIQN